MTAPPPPALYSLSLHDALPIFSELASHFGDHRRRRLADGGHRERGKPEHEHRAEQAGDEHHRLREIDHERLARVVAHLVRSEEHTSELQSPCNLVCRLLLEKKK